MIELVHTERMGDCRAGGRDAGLDAYMAVVRHPEGSGALVAADSQGGLRDKYCRSQGLWTEHSLEVKAVQAEI
ncbi:MAG: hypothetical protein LBF22_08980 [Deltaproteobacteria bacterium]|nr:hypothetical protein [Deltaproteobacteria bacterium]